MRSEEIASNAKYRKDEKLKTCKFFENIRNFEI